MNKQRNILRAIITVSLALNSSSCSVYMAAKQPEKKDLTYLKPGTPRPLVHHHLGSPVDTKTIKGNKQDLFSFTQGYSKGVKASRAVWHGAADVVTLGLWEVVGTPSEAIFDGKKMTFIVDYNNQDQVSKVQDLTPQPPKTESTTKKLSPR